MNLEKARHIYFLGIGGIGMSALARYLNEQNKMISGYDRDQNELTKKLEAEGMQIHYEVDVDLVPDDIDIVIYTPAIAKDQVEFVHVQNLGIPILKRSEALKLVLENKKVIAIGGTHGKTTTSAIMAHLLNGGGHNTTAFVGGIMKNYDSNFISGTSDRIIVEADEYDRSFLKLFPEMAVIQAMDADHLDIYDSLQDLHDAFKMFTLQIKRGGQIWMHGQVARKYLGHSWRNELQARSIELKTFGFETEDDLQAKVLVEEDGRSVFEIRLDGQNLICEQILPGSHNILNALGAIAVVSEFGVSAAEIQRQIKSFVGIERRFEWIHRSETLTIIDDYAHHPSEIEAVISTVRKHYGNNHLTVLFQPHLFSRTRDFMDDFAKSLGGADRVLLLDIYPAREIPIEGITSEKLLELIPLKSKLLIDKNDIKKYLIKDEVCVLLVLGAGDVNKLIPMIKSHLVNG